MGTAAQTRALLNHRRSMRERGMARYEVLGLPGDRELIRALARRLSEDDTDAASLRSEMKRSLGLEPEKRGGVLAALRRSPLVGAEIALTRPFLDGRKADL